MCILIAEDDPVSRRLLENTLSKWGYEVVSVTDGQAAWRILQTDNAPALAILDWMMPGMDGVEVCRRVRARPAENRPYIILLTAKACKDHIVEGLEQGADDYVTKPFDRSELKARIQQGWRIVELQTKLVQRVRDVEASLNQVKQLEELLPICCYCKKIRDDQNYWQQVDSYLSSHLDTKFSHGICPDCLRAVEQEFAGRISADTDKRSCDHTLAQAGTCS